MFWAVLLFKEFCAGWLLHKTLQIENIFQSGCSKNHAERGKVKK